MIKKMLSLSAVLLSITINTAHGDLVNNITIWDKEDGYNYRTNGSYFYVSTKAEDGEVENKCVYEQRWDLEGVFLDKGVLTMVGGYNFTKGEKDSDRNLITSGDLFIDVTGDAIYGPDAAKLFNDKGNDKNSKVNNIFGYDYVLDFNNDFSSYKIYSISNATLLDVSIDENNNSNPWRYKCGGTLIDSGLVTKNTYTDQETGFKGGFHNAVSMDLSFLNGENITTHFTMGCGNDNLMGKGLVQVPEPSMLTFFGIGLAFLGLNRKRKNK